MTAPGAETPLALQAQLLMRTIHAGETARRRGFPGVLAQVLAMLGHFARLGGTERIRGRAAAEAARLIADPITAAGAPHGHEEARHP